MALEAVVFPQGHLSYCSTVADKVAATTFSLGRCGTVIDDIDREYLEEEKGGVLLQEDHAAGSAVLSPPPAVPATPASRGRASPSAARRRRRRPKAAKNKEEAESQRLNHIAVERNRRRQMNDYLAVLRSVMPPSYAQRGDQASIVAGAINFVKELEQLLQSLEAQKQQRHRRHSHLLPAPPPPFAGFFTFPQFSASRGNGNENGGARRGVADVEVALAESHANVKVLAPRRPSNSNSKQLLRMVLAMRCLGLTVLHLNATNAADHLVFYSFSLKMEDECRLSSADEVAAAVHQMVAEIVADDDDRAATPI